MTATRAIVASLITVAAVSCGPVESDETRIRKAIESMARSIENGEPGPFLDRVAEDFTGDRGAWDRHRVRQYVLGQTIRRGERPTIDLGDVEIELYDGRARALVEADISGDGRWLPGRGARYRFATGWRREDGFWLVISAEWKRLR